MKDKFNRKINYLRISVTDRCNLRCRYCMPADNVFMDDDNILTRENIFDIVKAATKIGINKIRITGGEPLVRSDICEIIRDISSISDIKDISLTTNGILLSKLATSLRKAGLNRVNISLDTMDKEKYSMITRGGSLDSALAGIKAAIDNELTPIKINCVVMKGFNDDEIENFAKLTLNYNVDVRFIELMPIGHGENKKEYGYMSNDEVRSKIEGLYKITSDEISVASLYKLNKGKGRIGFISPLSSAFCPTCNKIRLTADGKLKPCLHSNDEIDVMNGDSIEEALINSIISKPFSHNLDILPPITRDMNRIGG